MRAVIICDETEPAKAAEVCEAGGYGIEIQSFYDPAYIVRTPDAVELHRSIVEGISLRSLHGPFGDLCPGSFDVMVRDLARYRYFAAVPVAKRLGVSHMVLHHSYVPHTSLPSLWVKRCIRFWREILRETPESISIHLENFLELDHTMMADLIEAVDSKRLDVCLDIGHAHCYSAQTVVQWIEQLRDKIGYVHMHDNRGEEDEHLALGDGTVPLEDVCNALEEHAPNALWAIETKSEYVEKSLARLREYGFID